MKLSKSCHPTVAEFYYLPEKNTEQPVPKNLSTTIWILLGACVAGELNRKQAVE